MMFDELLTDVKIEEHRQIKLAMVRVGGDARHAERIRLGGTRRSIAARMIRAGAWLDGEAAERFVVARRMR